MAAKFTGLMQKRAILHKQYWKVALLDILEPGMTSGTFGHTFIWS
jgi:hypothetical protein